LTSKQSCLHPCKSKACRARLSPCNDNVRQTTAGKEDDQAPTAQKERTMTQDLTEYAKERNIKYFLFNFTDLFGTQRAKGCLGSRRPLDGWKTG